MADTATTGKLDARLLALRYAVDSAVCNVIRCHGFPITPLSEKYAETLSLIVAEECLAEERKMREADP